MDTLLCEDEFNFIAEPDKAFIRGFDNHMTRLGYTFGGKIGSGICWGRYMLIYTKAGVISKKVYARIYIRDDSIALRLFLSKIDEHRAFIEQAPAHIKRVFEAGNYADCKHDRDEGNGNCRFRKIYTIDGRLIEKCNGLTFEFLNPRLEALDDYLALFTEFYPSRKTRAV